ncbi:MAG TPA: N-acetyltransferase [Pirellulales bacterium]|nr:N-acetyltransferase [Pirellulales bacterium]
MVPTNSTAAATRLSTAGAAPASNASAPLDFVVKPVETRRERKAFLELPWQLYRDDPNWIPPLRLNQKELVGYAHHPFYDDAKGQTFLALSGGRAIGRIEAIENPVHNRFHQERRGFFGFFESIDNQQVASALFDAARNWLAARDIHQMRGPVNPSLNYECGLLVDGFQIPPTFMMTYNHPYYGRLIENYGFRKAQDLFAFWAPIDLIPRLDAKLLFVAQEAASRLSLEMRPMDKSRFRQEIEMFLDLYNQSLGGTWGFVPLSKREIDHMSASLKHLIIPELAMVASVAGKPIGAVFAIPDYNPRIKQIDGRLFPFGFLKLISKKRNFRRFRVISANVIPEYQRWGVGLVLLRSLIPKILESNFQDAEFSWVLESNHLSRRSLEKGGAVAEKTYRIYDYPPPAEATPAT